MIITRCRFVFPALLLHGMAYRYSFEDIIITSAARSKYWVGEELIGVSAPALANQLTSRMASPALAGRMILAPAQRESKMFGLTTALIGQRTNC